MGLSTPSKPSFYLTSENTEEEGLLNKNSHKGLSLHSVSPIREHYSHPNPKGMKKGSLGQAWGMGVGNGRL